MRVSRAPNLKPLSGSPGLDSPFVRCCANPKSRTCTFTAAPSTAQLQHICASQLRTAFGSSLAAQSGSRHPRCPRSQTQSSWRSVACAGASADTTSSAPSPSSSSNSPFWRTHIARKPTLLQSLYECIARIRDQAPMPERVDLAMVYVSSAYETDYDRLVGALRTELPGLRNVFGCTGFGIIGVDEEGAHEVEGAPALSLTLASLPQAEVVVRHVDVSSLPDGDAAPDRWSSLLGVPAFPEAPLSFVVLSDPGFTGIQDLLAGLDFAFPTATKIGGLSSAGSPFGGANPATFCWSAAPATSGASTTAASAAAGSPPQAPASSTNITADTAISSSSSSSTGAGAGVGGADSSDATISSSSSSSSGGGVRWRGASVLAIHGEVHMDLMIAQGCRPLTSTTWTVDRVAPGDPTRILTLSSESVAKGRPLPALEAFQVELQSVLSGMSEVQLRRTVANLTVGLAPEGLKQNLEPQDFLIRMLRGFDPEQCLVVGDYMRAGQRVRFMVRDKQGAQEDLTSHGLAYKRKQLQAMLTGGAAQQPPPFGMLMFTCNGRGSSLYGEASYDARTMSTYVPVPCAGFQCNGEIGRVGNTTHLHGFTCAVGVLRLTSEVAANQTGAGAGSSAGAAPGRSAPPPPPAPPASAPPSQPQPQGQQPTGEE